MMTITEKDLKLVLGNAAAKLSNGFDATDGTKQKSHSR